MNKKVKLILFLSIILNIVLLSFQLGCGFASSSPEKRIQKKQGKIIAVLSDDKKQLARETFEKLNKIREKKFASFREELKKVKPIIVAPNFDEKVF